MFSEMNLWKKYDNNLPLEKFEIQILIESARRGLDYLEARRDNLAASKTRMDLMFLRELLQKKK